MWDNILGTQAKKYHSPLSHLPLWLAREGTGTAPLAWHIPTELQALLNTQRGKTQQWQTRPLHAATAVTLSRLRRASRISIMSAATASPYVAPIVAQPARLPATIITAAATVAADTAAGGGGGYGRSERTMTQVTCASCGKETEVPFVPRGDRPVYCSDCFSKQGGGRSGGGGGRGRY